MPRENGAKAQRQRLLDALRRGPVDTVYVYRHVDILHVPRRVLELRLEGHDITTTWAQRATEQGSAHRVGVYALIKPAPPAQGELL